jgi:hypothetical protein
MRRRLDGKSLQPFVYRDFGSLVSLSEYSAVRDWVILNPQADDLQLTECRCPTRVVHMANNLIAHNQLRLVPRGLTPRAVNGPGDVRIIQYDRLFDEVSSVTQIVRGMIENGVPPGDILILAQRGVIGTPIYQALHGYNVPVRSFDADGEVIAVRPVESIGAGEEALVNLVGQRAARDRLARAGAQTHIV